MDFKDHKLTKYYNSTDIWSARVQPFSIYIGKKQKQASVFAVLRHISPSPLLCELNPPDKDGLMRAKKIRQIAIFIYIHIVLRKGLYPPKIYFVFAILSHLNISDYQT